MYISTGYGRGIRPDQEDVAAEVMLSIRIYKRTDKTACPFFRGIKATIGAFTPNLLPSNEFHRFSHSVIGREIQSTQKFAESEVGFSLRVRC